MRKSKTRKRARKIHANNRAAERYGINFGKQRRRLAIAAIQDKKAIFVRRGNGKKTIWDVPYEDTTIRVVYSSATKTIVTVLPITTKKE